MGRQGQFVVNITIISVGTRGDVQPSVALGIGLQRSGHTVRVATHRIFEELVRSRGLGFAPIAGDPLALVIEWCRNHDSTNKATGRSFFRELLRVSLPQFEQSVTDALESCRDAEVIISSPIAVTVGFHVAEKLGIPLVRTAYVPKVPTSRYPAFRLPHVLNHAHVNLWTYQILRQAVWLMIRTPTNHARTSCLQLPPLHWTDPFGLLDRNRQLLLVAYSPSVFPPPPDWGDWICQAGYWFLDHASDWEPDQDLVNFIHAGPPPVYVGFGSMPSTDPVQATEIVIRALTQVGQRGVLSTGWHGLARRQNSDEFFFVDDVPHDWLFPQMAAAVHHGGMGTMAAALRAGIPSITVPTAADQPLWSRRAWNLHVSPRPIPRGTLTVERLAEALRNVVTRPEMRQCAATLGERIRQEDGVGRAVDAFNHWVSIRSNHISSISSPAA